MLKAKINFKITLSKKKTLKDYSLESCIWVAIFLDNLKPKIAETEP